MARRSQKSTLNNRDLLILLHYKMDYLIEVNYLTPHFIHAAHGSDNAKWSKAIGSYKEITKSYKKKLNEYRNNITRVEDRAP